MISRKIQVVVTYRVWAPNESQAKKTIARLKRELGYGYASADGDGYKIIGRGKIK